MATVDGDHAAGHEAAGLRRQQQQRAVEMLGLADAPLRDALDQPLAAGRLPEVAVHLGLDVAGADRVDPDVVARPLHGQRARQMDQAGLRGVVGRHLADGAQARGSRRC